MNDTTTTNTAPPCDPTIQAVENLMVAGRALYRRGFPKPSAVAVTPEEYDALCDLPVIAAAHEYALARLLDSGRRVTRTDRHRQAKLNWADFQGDLWNAAEILRKTGRRS